MNSLVVQASNASHRAAQLFIAIVSLLILGKLITWVPVMKQLQLFDVFQAAEIVWLLSEAIALFLFFFFVRYAARALPDNGRWLAFLKAIAESLAVLIIVVFAQALLWQLLSPFAGATGRTVYYGVAVFLIVAASTWLVMKAYQNAIYVVDAIKKTADVAQRSFSGRGVVCDRCQAELASDARFCSQCGHQLAEPLHCRECGRKISQGQKFCQYCGAKTSLHD